MRFPLRTESNKFSRGGGVLNVIQLGPLLLNFELLIFVLSAFTGYLALKHRLSQATMEEKISEKFITAIILGFFTWKFSLILFDLSLVIQHPMSLLYFNGGDRGLWLAITISILYLWIRTRKEGTSIKLNLDVLVAGLLVGSSIYQLLLLIVNSTNTLFHSLYIFLAVGLHMFLYINKKAVGNSLVLNQLVMWFSLGMIGISFAEKTRIYFFFGFSKEQFLFFFIFIITLFAGRFLENPNTHT